MKLFVVCRGGGTVIVDIADQVADDCVVMDARRGNDVQMPNGVGKRETTVKLEKHDPTQVDGASSLELSKSYVIHLK